MTRPLRRFPDPERATVDLLAGLLAEHEPEVTVGIGVPADWHPDSSPPHVAVAWDGTPWTRRGIVARASMRCTARAATTSEAKRLALLAEGLLLGHTGGDGISNVRTHIGVMPARDPETQVELAWFSVGVTVRSEPIPVPS